MGLDMYLTKKIYIGNKYREPNEMIKVKMPKSQKGVIFPTDGIDDSKITYIEEEAAYWRKANHIHNWFVKNVQEGEDDCKDYYVDESQLKKLLRDCETVRKSLIGSPTKKVKIESGYANGKKTYREEKVFTKTKVAEELLPTQEGFFFGNTEYDEYYLRDIRNTIKMIKKILKNSKGGEFYYSASW